MQTSMYRMNRQKDPLYSTGNFIKYPVMKHNAKNMEKNVYVYVCVCNLSHCYTIEINTTLQIIHISIR